MTRARNNSTRALRFRRAAFTLAETLIASIVLAIVAASAILPFVAGAQQLNAATEFEFAASFGEELMEEIIARPFHAPHEDGPTPGPEATETDRRFYDSVDDFDGYSELKTGTQSYLLDYRGGNTVDEDHEGYWRDVSVTYVAFTEQTEANAIVKIEVRVHRYNNLLLRLNRLKVRED